MSDPSPGSRPDLSNSVALAERLGVGRYDFEVVDAAALTPSMRRILLRAVGLDEFTFVPGQDLMLSVPTGDDKVIRRRYTIRSFDAPLGVIELQLVSHGDGPGARWASEVTAGGRIEGIGPRGKVTAVPGADWHLFVGDETFLPAAFAMAEGLASSTPALLVLEVDSADDEQALQASAPVVGPVWVHRGGGTTLADVVGTLELPPGSGHAYLGGEAHAVRELRDLLVERGVPADAIDAKAYWRNDAPNALHGEPDR